MIISPPAPKASKTHTAFPDHGDCLARPGSAVRPHMEAPSPKGTGQPGVSGGTVPPELHIHDRATRGGCPSPRTGCLPSLDTKNKLRSPSNGAGESTKKESPIYRVYAWSYPKWKGETVRELKVLGNACKSTKARGKVERRAKAFQMCGNHVLAHRCGDCATPIPNSGVVTARTSVEERGKPCNSGLCPACNRARSMKRAHKLQQALPTLPTYAGYSYKEIVLTFQYDPSDADHVSVEGLRVRALAAKKAVKEAWSFIMGPKGARGWAISNVEIAGTGNVHAHMLVYCPFVHKDAFEARLSELDVPVDGVKPGHSWVECIGTDVTDPEVQRAVWEVCKYNAKGPSSLSESFYDRSGEGREALAPRLAAAWEVATTDGPNSRLQLSQVYGDLRGNMDTNDDLEETDDMEAAQDDGVAAPACPHCGGSKVTEVVEWVVTWVEECHKRGYGGLRGSRWEPWRGGRSRPREGPHALSHY